MINVAKAICDASHPGISLEQMLSDDTLIYAGAATWEQWENHIPPVAVKLWPELSMESRALLFIMAESVV